jgi:hypothetical protein
MQMETIMCLWLKDEDNGVSLHSVQNVHRRHYTGSVNSSARTARRSVSKRSETVWSKAAAGELEAVYGHCLERLRESTKVMTVGFRVQI